MGYIEERLQRLREKLSDKGIDAALVTKRENYMYLSGFTGTSAYLLITQEKTYLITDFRYIEQATNQAPLFEVVKYQGSVVAAINSLITSSGIKSMGFEDSALTYDAYVKYKNNLKLQGFVPLEGIIEKLRIKKDDLEIKKIKDAVKVADDAFSHVVKLIKPGVAEIEIAAEIEYFMKKNGAIGPSFETIVASGKRAALPHGVASEKKLETGDVVTMDYGAIYGEYCSDMTRTVFLGKPSDELLKIYRIVLDAQLKAIEGAIAGVSGKDIDTIARGHIEKNGYENCFGHGLGHGVGLEIHEEPRLSPMGNLIMKDGMVVTVEPGIYVTGLGGVRIEDMIVINGEKPEILTSSTKELIIL